MHIIFFFFLNEIEKRYNKEYKGMEYKNVKQKKKKKKGIREYNKTLILLHVSMFI